MLSDAIREAIRLHCGEPVIRAERLGGGRNSRVHKAETDTHCFAVKEYFKSPNDSRDRQKTEAKALQVLARQEGDLVPSVLLVRDDLGFTLLNYMEGTVITENQMGPEDEQRFIDFVRTLIRISKEEDGDLLPAASEAFFTLREIVANIEFRLNRLEKRCDPTPLGDELDDFLARHFRPALSRLSNRAVSYYEAVGLTEEAVLDRAHRVLSPSDFGLHNCLKAEHGLIFLDFEYFGWDDPVKMISDYVLHPAQGRAGAKRMKIAGKMLDLFDGQTTIRERAKALFPLFGLKWCMILLNEFLAAENARRVFSGEDDDRETVLKRQLGLARSMLEQVLDTSEPAFLTTWKA